MSDATDKESEMRLDIKTVRDREWQHIKIARKAACLAVEGTCRDTGVGLALSGGGIRSATFCLGVLQALARKDCLTRVDYLSTVSGGGYIGGWLSAWVHRKGLAHVNRELKRSPADLTPGEAPEVAWLRRYSNYMAPKLGLLSADSLTLVATWFRNVLLNLVIVVMFLALLFLLPRLLLEPTLLAMIDFHRPVGYAAAWIAFFVVPVAISFNLSAQMSQDPNQEVVLMNTTWGVILAVIVPGMLAAWMGSAALFSPQTYFQDHTWELLRGGAGMLAMAGVLWFIYQVLEGVSWRETAWEALVFVLAYACALGTSALLLSYLFSVIRPIGPTDAERAANLLTFGPPSLLVLFGVVGSVIVGIVSGTYRERSREWWSRMNAWFIIIGLAWLVVCALAFYAAPVATWAYGRAGDWLTALGAGWIGSLLISLLAPKPTSADSAWSKYGQFGLAAALSIVVAGLLFAVAAGIGFAIEKAGMTACGIHTECHSSAASLPPAAESVSLSVVSRSETAAASVAAAAKNGVAKLELASGFEGATVATLTIEGGSKQLADHLEASFVLQNSAMTSGVNLADREVVRAFVTAIWDGVIDLAVAAAVSCLAVLLLFGWRIDVNKFSLQGLYKNRLVRCYLGASRQDVRRPNPFTGFDESDDLPLFSLREMKAEPQGGGVNARPFHIVNAALNITQGKNLAWQERKAGSFTFTPLHCGFTLGPSTGDAGPLSAQRPSVKVGHYRDAQLWASDGGEPFGEDVRGAAPGRLRKGAFFLGSAMATSGAAVSTISGKSSSSAMAFVATVFNARLGRWSPNPGGADWKRSGPSFGLLHLLMELFGHTTEEGRFVHLSDGGHFDNTGAYELVRRQCRTIVVVDATADPTGSMEDLANLVRKCRVDFGARISFEGKQRGSSWAEELSSTGYVLGSIDYGAKPNGSIVVIKPTSMLHSKLSADIFSYARSRPSFPHQTTVDQFFSESQFESYRELGERITEACLYGGLADLLTYSTEGDGGRSA